MKFSAFEPIDLKNNSPELEVYNLQLSQIIPNQNQPRKIFEENTLEELALSIKQYGVIQPIIVRKYNDSQYQIIAGERRWRAAKLAGLEVIPAIIRTYDQSERLAVALIENIQRQSLNSLEEAHAIQCLLEACEMTHQQVAENIGKSRATVSNLLRLLSLEPAVKNLINQKLLEMGHARALLVLNGDKQIEVANAIVNKNLSVRETEKFVQTMGKQLIKQEAYVPYVSPGFEKKVSYWEKFLSEQLSSKVDMRFNSAGKGRVVIHFDSVEEADWLMDNLQVQGNEKFFFEK